MRRWAVLALGAVAAATLVGQPAGLGLTVTTCALLALTARRPDRWSVAWWVLATALAAMATVRAAGWVVWPCLAAALALGSLAAARGTGWRQVAVGLVPRPSLTVLRVPLAVHPRGGWRHPLTAAGIGAILLAVFVPLFATADAAFAHLLGQLVPEQAVDDPLARAATWLIVALMGGALLTARMAAPAAAGTPRLATIEWAAPLTVLVTLFAAFVALQLTTLYGGHDHVLDTAGLTYAEYAREGFAQLLAVAALVAFAISNPDRRVAEHNVDRFERTGRIDPAVLRGLSPDAVPALVRLPTSMLACEIPPGRVGPDGLAGLNLGRQRARDALARLDPLVCL